VISVAEGPLSILVQAVQDRLASRHPRAVLEEQSDAAFVQYRYISLIISTKSDNTKIIRFVKMKLKIQKPLIRSCSGSN